MRSVFGLSTVLMGATVLVMQPAYALAQTSPAQIRQTAQSITVFIQSLNRPDVFGSGVIVSKSGNTYSILTAKHVVSLSDSYIVTAGGTKYPAIAVKPLPNIDLAVVQFQTDSPFTIATKAQTLPGALDRIYVAGFPKPTPSVPSIEFTIVAGDVNTVIATGEARDGYGLRYGARTRVGMSGGPVLNDSGQLVAIHGQADDLGGLAMPLQPYQSSISALLQGTQQIDLARQQAEQEKQRQAELARQQAEQEKQRQTDLARQQAEQEKQRQADLARQQAEQEKQRQTDLARQQAEQEKKRQTDLARQQTEQEKQRQAELARQQQNQNQQTVLLAKIEPFPPPASVTATVNVRTEEVCEWVSFGGTRVRRCSTVAVNSPSPPAQTVPEFETYLRRGNELAAMGRYEQAIAAYTQAINAKSDYAYAYFNRGLSLAKAGQADQALADLQKARDLFQSQGKTPELAKVQDTITIINRSRGLS